MTEILVAVKTLLAENGTAHVLSYYRVEQGRSYGVCVKERDGAVVCVQNLTQKRPYINALLRKMVRGGVSTVSVRDVAEDWLAG